MAILDESQPTDHNFSFAHRLCETTRTGLKPSSEQKISQIGVRWLARPPENRCQQQPPSLRNRHSSNEWPPERGGLVAFGRTRAVPCSCSKASPFALHTNEIGEDRPTRRETPSVTLKTHEWEPTVVVDRSFTLSISRVSDSSHGSTLLTPAGRFV